MIRNNLLFTLFVSLFFALGLFANDYNSSVESNQSETPKYQAKVLYAKYKSFPKVVYTKQRFNITLGLNIFLDDDQFFRISTQIEDGVNIDSLTNEIIWYMNDDKEYETTLKFKASDSEFVFPNITITVYDRSGVVIDSHTLKKPNIHFRKIAINQERYSNIIATYLEVTSVKARQFSNDEIMVLLEIDSQNGNLEEFHIAKYANQGLKDIIVNKNKQKIYYFIMVPIFEKAISFEYYNPTTSKFVAITIPIKVKEELVSTQTNLNPYESDVDFYKRIILIFIVLVFIIIYMFRKKKKYLFVAMAVMSTLLIFSMPNPKEIVKANEKVYILPTKNSTVFKILKNDEEVEVLGFNDTKEYKKVLFKNNQIGWVKND